MLSLRLSNYGCTWEVGRVPEKRFEWHEATSLASRVLPQLLNFSLRMGLPPQGLIWAVISGLRTWVSLE